jgi:hypothetical protein
MFLTKFLGAWQNYGDTLEEQLGGKARLGEYKLNVDKLDDDKVTRLWELKKELKGERSSLAEDVPKG